MELDIKNLGDQDMRQLVKSLELVSRACARFSRAR